MTPSVAVAHFQGIEKVLRSELFSHRGAAQADADNAPVAAVFIQHGVGVHGLVGAVKGAHAQMHDARAELLSVIAGRLDPGKRVRGVQSHQTFNQRGRAKEMAGIKVISISAISRAR